ncbi:MAG: helix-turn-helix domain-containing protein [Oscillospiraceae bacterium]|nr:helix-turn-helix domain-containing protein [Oscillospiraceae bacterium]
MKKVFRKLPTLLHKPGKHLYQKMFVCFLLPVAFLLLAFFFNSEYFFHYLGNRTKDSYRQSLRGISSYVNSQMKEIVETSILLSNSQDLKQVFYSSEIIGSKNRYQLSNSIQALITFKSTKDLIDSSFIIQKSNACVISTQGLFSYRDFFGTYFSYQKYKETFWLTSKPGGLNYRILAATPVKDKFSNTNKSIIPILEYGIGLNRSSNLLVINVDEKKIAEVLKAGKVTPNSQLYIFDADNRLISSTESRPVESLQDLPPEISHPANGADTSGVTIGGKKYLTVYYAPKLDFLDGFKFVALVPYRDIQNDTFPLRTASQVFMAFCLAAGLTYSYFTSKKLYSPIGKLMLLFNKKRASPGCDEFEYAVIIWIDCQDVFFETFTNDQIAEIIKTIPAVFINLLDSGCQCYLLPLEKYKSCVLINSPDGSAAAPILKALNQLVNLLAVDKKYLSVYAAVGNPVSGFGNVHQSFREAERMCSLFSPFNPERVILYRPFKDSIHCIYSIDDENKLFNYLMTGNKDEVRRLISSILAQNSIGSLNESCLKELYIQIYNTCVRALSSKGVKVENLMGESSVDLIRDFRRLSANDLAAYLDRLIRRILPLMQKGISRPALSEIKKYIDSHYSEDIYLEMLAQKYHISVKYMSKLLKDALNESFKKYLTDLRIAKSKELLKDRKQSISEIAGCVGFNSRNTFIRAFKMREGITPSEYRSLSAKGEKGGIARQ